MKEEIKINWLLVIMFAFLVAVVIIVGMNLEKRQQSFSLNLGDPNYITHYNNNSNVTFKVIRQTPERFEFGYHPTNYSEIAYVRVKPSESRFIILNCINSTLIITNTSISCEVKNG